jgi:SAM-dependent methyltransferase
MRTEYWDAAAATKVFTHPLYGPWLAGLDRDAAVFDYGCGYGRILAELEGLGFHDLSGADISPAMIERARREQPAARLTVITDPPAIPQQQDASVGAVLLFAVLTCVPEDGAQQALLAETARLLEPGGLLYLSDLLLQADPRNLERYDRGLRVHGRYGVFETGDGAVCRHHEPAYLRELVTGLGFMIEREREIEVATMNGNAATGIQLLARKPAA